MKKQFPLRSPNKANERVLDAVKHDVRKYVKRERGKTIPDGFNQWEFDCRVGTDAASAEPWSLGDVARAIDVVAASGAESVYVEVLARAAQRPASPRAPASSTDDPSPATP